LKAKEKFSNLLFIDGKIKRADVIISGILSKLFGITQKRIPGNSLSVFVLNIEKFGS
jgi:hypothetical protein